MSYSEFLARRAQLGGDHGFAPDVIDRCLTLWSNPGERVLTPFMGVGSEVYGAVRGGRFGIGVELKPSYYRQAVANLQRAEEEFSAAAGATLFQTGGHA